MPDEALLESERQDVDDHARRVAKDIVMMLLETGADAQRVLAYVDAMLHLKLPGEDPHPSDAA